MSKRREPSLAVKLPGVWGRMDPQTAQIFLGQTLGEIESAEAATYISPRTAALTKSILLQITRQLAPHWDARMRLVNWQLAMLAAALVDRRLAGVETAVLAAIQTLTPARENDGRFRETILRTYRKLRQGTNPARGMQLEPIEEVIGMAAKKLPKRKSGNFTR